MTPDPEMQAAFDAAFASTFGAALAPPLLQQQEKQAGQQKGQQQMPTAAAFSKMLAASLDHEYGSAERYTHRAMMPGRPTTEVGALKSQLPLVCGAGVAPRSPARAAASV